MIPLVELLRSSRQHFNLESVTDTMLNNPYSGNGGYHDSRNATEQHCAVSSSADRMQSVVLLEHASVLLFCCVAVVGNIANVSVVGCHAWSLGPARVGPPPGFDCRSSDVSPRTRAYGSSRPSASAETLPAAHGMGGAVL